MNYPKRLMHPKNVNIKTDQQMWTVFYMAATHAPNIYTCLMKPSGRKKISKNLEQPKYQHLCHPAKQYQYKGTLNIST